MKYICPLDIRLKGRINFESFEVSGGWPRAIPSSFFRVTFVQISKHRGSVNVEIISGFEVSGKFLLWRFFERNVIYGLCKWEIHNEYPLLSILILCAGNNIYKILVDIFLIGFKIILFSKVDIHGSRCTNINMIILSKGRR